MFFRFGRILCPALLGIFILAACSRQAGKAPEERIAILRFENLGPDASYDWMGRGFSELLSEQLTGQPNRYAISSNTLHGLGQNMGARPVQAPGVSSESPLAQLAAATQVGYGEFTVRQGRLEARLYLEDVSARKYRKVIFASSGADDIIGVANALARQVAANLAPIATRNNQAIRSWVKALESRDPDEVPNDAAAAMAADPAFTPAYRLLAGWKAQRRDTAAALALLDEASKHASSAIERARIDLQAAGVRNDAIGRRKALAELANADPGNPDEWRLLANTQFAAHTYTDSVASFRRQLALEPMNLPSLNLLGYASAYAGDFVAGLEALRRYQAAAPNSPDPLDSTGDIHLLAGHLREAEQFDLLAYQKNPKYLDGGDLFKAAMARLMAGDIPGATEFHERYLKALAEIPGRILEIERAEWLWTTGRRKEAYQQLLAFTRSMENGPKRDFAARGYAELATWSLMLGDRTAAAQMAQKAFSIPGVQLSASALVARFLAQPSAPASEWSERASKLFANPGLETVRDVSLACALLIDKEYQPASEILRKLYDGGVQTPVDEGIPAMLAWALLETGHDKEAAPLLRFNPVPPSSGFTVFTAYYFPRLFFLRGLVAEKNGRAQEARDNWHLFLQLSGPDSLGWSEEQKARSGG